MLSLHCIFSSGQALQSIERAFLALYRISHPCLLVGDSFAQVVDMKTQTKGMRRHIPSAGQQSGVHSMWEQGDAGKGDGSAYQGGK